MAFDRSESRNIHFFDERNPDVVLGGLVQNSLVTERKFLSILSIILVATAPIYVCAGVTGNAVSVIDELPGLGDYMVRCEGEIHLNDEPWAQRIISYNVSGREDAFRDRIRVHDQKCVISGVMHRRPNNWTTSEAAHIFPLAKENHWIQYNYGLWIREWQKGEDGAEHKADVNDGPRILRATTYDNRFVQVEKDPASLKIEVHNLAFKVDSRFNKVDS